MGFSGFGKVQKQAKKFDLDAIFEKTKREAKTILSHNGTDCTTLQMHTLTVTLHTAPASDDNSKDDDDDMIIGPPISLAQPDESSATVQQVNHLLYDNSSILNHQTSHNTDNKKADSDEDSDYDDSEVW